MTKNLVARVRARLLARPAQEDIAYIAASEVNRNTQLRGMRPRSLPTIAPPRVGPRPCDAALDGYCHRTRSAVNGGDPADAATAPLAAALTELAACWDL